MFRRLLVVAALILLLGCASAFLFDTSRRQYSNTFLAPPPDWNFDNLGISNNLYVDGNLFADTIVSRVQINQIEIDLNVVGDANISGDLNVVGNITAGGNFDVVGDSNFFNIGITGALYGISDLNIGSNTRFGSGINSVDINAFGNVGNVQELLHDPEFNNAAEWALDPNWSIAGGTLTHAAAAGDDAVEVNPCSIIIGEDYVVEGTVVTNGGGGVNVTVGGQTVINWTSNETGSFSLIVTASATTAFKITTPGGPSSLSRVSLKHVPNTSIGNLDITGTFSTDYISIVGASKIVPDDWLLQGAAGIDQLEEEGATFTTAAGAGSDGGPADAAGGGDWAGYGGDAGTDGAANADGGDAGLDGGDGYQTGKGGNISLRPGTSTGGSNYGIVYLGVGATAPGGTQATAGIYIDEDYRKIYFGVDSPNDGFIDWDGANGTMRIDPNLRIGNEDSASLYFGGALDASILYNSVDLIINPKAVGSGKVFILGDLNVNGDVNIDGRTSFGSGANYSDFNGTGQLKLHGAARVRRELIFPARNSAKGASAPTEALRDLGASGNLKFPTLEFSKTIQQDIYGEFHPPFDIDNSEDIEFHLMWLPGAAWTTGDYNWCLEYLVKYEDISYGADVNTTLGTPTIICEVVTPTNANSFIETEFSSTIDIDFEKTLSVHFYRDVASDNGDDTGDVRFFEAEYIVNSLGKPI